MFSGTYWNDILFVTQRYKDEETEQPASQE